MELSLEQLAIPHDANVIVGQAHFIKTVEDIFEALVNTVPGIRFGVAFCEASGKCLVRAAGTDPDLQQAAESSAMQIGAGHSFIIYLRNAFPINVLFRIKQVPEVCRIYCASANPVQLILARTEQGKGILGVIDGSSPVGIEQSDDVQWRKDLLRKIGYKQ